ncbi:MAG: signal peptidase I, partial [Clostridia bacterium]|nr:signal peptidase I [Clostridia bacterium]
MSDFDREKYGDYEDAMKRLMDDPIFSEIENSAAGTRAPQAEPAPAEEPAAPAFPEPEAEPESPADETPEPDRASDYGEPAESEQSEDYLPIAAAAAPTAEKKKRRDPLTGVFVWVESAIFAVVVVILIFPFVFRIVGIDGRSMVPTLQDDDRVVISNLFYTPKTGDIVVLDTSEDTIFFNGRQYSKPLIKRVIATGGQTVEVTSAENGAQEVYVDGVKLDESYINFQTVAHSPGQTKLTVPKG